MRSIFIVSLLALYFSATTSYIRSIASIKKIPGSILPLVLKHKPLNKLTKMAMTGGYLNKLNIQQYISANISKTNIRLIDMPLTTENINISSIYLNIDKVKGVYFSRDVNNVIFTFPEKLTDLYYYDVNNTDTEGVLYRVSNNTRINMKNLKKFVFQSFNNNVDGILF
jgi:hypothetical protein